ncbi:MAG: hypothetical protein ACYTFX_11075 [Planctomycetota bacterium]
MTAVVSLAWAFRRGGIRLCFVAFVGGVVDNGNHFCSALEAHKFRDTQTCPECLALLRLTVKIEGLAGEKVAVRSSKSETAKPDEGM